MDSRDIILRKLETLSRSKFRNSFKLNSKDKEYVLDKGLDKIIDHTYEFVNKRLVDSNIFNDGKQTPIKGHPVFIAQHATATCCRECLYKWHQIDKGRKLTDNEINYIVSLIISWIIKEINRK